MASSLRRPHLVLALAVALVALALGCGVAWAETETKPEAERIVSLNPSLTAILVSIGAAESIVGVDDYSAEKISVVASLPRVGGLFSPSLEAVVSLRPDVVVLVPSAEQRDFRTRLGELGVRVVAFENLRFDEVLANIRGLGALAGREVQAAERIRAIVEARESARRRAKGRARPGVLVVLQRDPVYVVGGGNFIQEMLEDLGARNLAAGYDESYPRVAAEWVVAEAPDVLIDLSPSESDPQAHWSRWPSIPAVARGRVVALDAELISMPGPDLDRALEALEASLYGDADPVAADREP
jgi:ABC-type Fe3+-hydroxamate transport system substrate-binding protein